MLRIDTLVVKGTLDEVDTGVARLIRGTGKVDELDSGLGLGRLAGSLGGCVSEVRDCTARARPTARSTTWRYRSPLRVGLSVIPWGEERGRDSMGFV